MPKRSSLSPKASKSPKRKKSSSNFRVAFQGAAGAFSEIAIQNAHSKSKGRGNLETVGCDTFSAVFSAVDNDEVDAGILPRENSVSSSITEVIDLLVQYEGVHIVEETCEVETLCICAAKDVPIDTITEVHSDADHLEQCSHFVAQLGASVKQCVTWDSAGACQAVKAGGDKNVAAIASKNAAKLHGLKVLKENVSNLGGLATRYIIIAKEPAKITRGTSAKSSLVALLKNEPMSLMKLVSAFSLRGMNITKLESQPACHVRNDMFSGRHFDYLFFVDFEPKDESSTKALMNNIQEFAQSTRLLGTYAKNVTPLEVDLTDMPWTAYY